MPVLCENAFLIYTQTIAKKPDLCENSTVKQSQNIPRGPVRGANWLAGRLAGWLAGGRLASGRPAAGSSAYEAEIARRVELEERSRLAAQSAAEVVKAQHKAAATIQVLMPLLVGAYPPSAPLFSAQARRDDPGGVLLPHASL